MGNKVPRPPPREAVDDPTRTKGLYPTCAWDESRVRRLINDRRLAPCYAGREHGGVDDATEECPICMFYYPLMNRTGCCRSAICTECYLQVAPEKTAASASCPFCKAHRLTVLFVGPRSEAEIAAERANRDELVAAQIRMLQNYLTESTTPNAIDATADSAPRTPEAADRAGAGAGAAVGSTCQGAGASGGDDGRAGGTGGKSSSCAHVSSRRGSATSSASVSPRMLTPLPSPELLASSPQAAALLSSAEFAAVLPAAFSTTLRAPPIRLDVSLAENESYASRWERAQAEQAEAARHSSLANKRLPPPPTVAPPPRTLEGLIGTAALHGAAQSGWTHAEAASVEEMMVLEAIRLSLEAAGDAGGPSAAPGAGAGGADTVGAAAGGSADGTGPSSSAAADGPADGFSTPPSAALASSAATSCGEGSARPGRTSSGAVGT